MLLVAFGNTTPRERTVFTSHASSTANYDILQVYRRAYRRLDDRRNLKSEIEILPPGPDRIYVARLLASRHCGSAHSSAPRVVEKKKNDYLLVLRKIVVVRSVSAFGI